MNSLPTTIALLPIYLLMGCATESEWVPLFDGESLQGWQVKITGHELATTTLTPTRTLPPGGPF